MRNMVLLVACLSLISLYGCPPPMAKPRPRHEPAPAHVPPGQIKRQTTPSGPKPIPPGQMKKTAPAPAPVVVVPVLPSIVVIEPGQHYYHEGFYYFLEGGVWYYSDKKDGPRKKLPKSHYPKEVKSKGKGKGKGREKGRD